MKQFDLLWNAIEPLLDDGTEEDRKKIHTIFNHFRDIHGRLEEKYRLAIRNRFAVHALLTKTSEDLIQRYQTLFEHSGTAMIVIEEDCTISLANTLFEKISGFTREEIEQNMHFYDFLIDDCKERLLVYHQKRRENDPTIPDIFHTRARTKSGTVLEVNVSVGLFPNSKQSVASIIDITEERKTKERLEQSEKKFRYQYEFLQQLIDAIPNPVFYRDTLGVYQGCNKALTSFTGRTREEIIGKTVYEIWPKDLAEELFSKDMLLITQPGVQYYETELLHRDETLHPVIVNKATYFNPDGSVMGIIGVFIDISKRKQAEEQMQKSEERYRLLLQNVSDGVIVYAISGDNHNRILEANDKICQILGYSREELVRMSMEDLEVNGGHGDILHPSEETEANIHQVFEQEYIRKDKVRIPVEISARLFELQGKEMVLAVIRDITERRMLDVERECHTAELKQHADALQQANDKLNILNRITRHDINNQLTTIIGYLDLLKEECPDPEVQKYLGIQTQAAENIQEQIMFAKEYQDIGAQAPRWFRVLDLIDSAAVNLLLPQITLSEQVDEWEIFADPLIVKVFYTLLENAIRHGEKVTSITFSCQRRGSDLAIVYEDDGAGVPAEHKEDIFQQKFFKHTGFGLFLAATILHITGISITENGEYGTGARFEIIVPEGAYRPVNPHP